MRRGLTIGAAIGLLWALSPAFADDTLPPASLRFAAADVGETPDFQRHVGPLLGRLGCNGRACHGSFQGQGGFRLSLFGYDFAADHQSLSAAAGDDERRVDLKHPDRSLILRKPTLAVDHEGGRRFDSGGWEERLLRRWIEAGAKGTSRRHSLMRLAVEPAEIVFAENGESQSLKVVAHWSDGAREDVTCLCRFQANDESVVDVSPEGRVAARGPGDTHVVVFYDNGVAAVPVLLPVSSQTGDRYPAVPTPTKIDELVVAKLRKLGIVPAPLCSDGEFLRRASIDATGTLPTPAEIEAFLADRSADKRCRKIDELLERPAYAAWWANRLGDYTGNSPFRQSDAGQQQAVQWYHWLRKRIEENVPYDRIVADIVLAVSRKPGQNYDDYAAERSAYFRTDDPTDFTACETMPHYWTRNNLRSPEDKALAFAYSFLGIRLQCAQCHKHPYDRWSQDDFRDFAAFFKRITYGVVPETKADYERIAKAAGVSIRNDGTAVNADLLQLAALGKVLPWRELYVAPAPAEQVRVDLLQSEEVTLTAEEDPRAVLMAWMRRADNPYFARALVNRVWANYFHVGIVDPPDDANLANPPSNGPLLEWLAREFVDERYDLRWLHRTIMNSDAYQRSWQPNETNRLDTRNFSRAVPRRLPAEVVYDALTQATAADDRLEAVRSDLTRRAIGHLSTLMAGTYAMNTFGKPDRTTACDCERSTETTLLQSVFMQNDPLLKVRLKESGWLDEAAAKLESDDADDRVAMIRAVYLRILGRPPVEAEIERAERHAVDATAPREWLADLAWALFNTKEFILNH